MALLQGRSEVRLGVHGQIHGEQAELHSGTSRRTAKYCLRAKLGGDRLHLQYHRADEKGGGAGGLTFFDSRRHANLAADGSYFPGRTPPQRGEAVHGLSARAGTASANGYVVAAHRSAAARGL